MALAHWIAAIITAAAYLPAAAEAPARWKSLAQPVFQHVAAAHGPPNYTTTLAQDGEGFLWIGAFGGLARWDGYRLRVFEAAPTTPGALPDGVIQALYADRMGRIWIGTNAHGLLRFDAMSEQFIPVAAGAQGIAHVSVLSIAGDDSGGLWVGTDAGVDHLDASGKVIERFAPELPEPHARALVQARNGVLWVGTSQGLARRGAKDRNFTVVKLIDGAEPEVDSLCEDTQGRIWAGTRGHGAFVVEAGGNVVESASPPGDPLASQSVYAIAEARRGEMWLGTFGLGVVVIRQDGSLQRMRNNPALPASLVNDSVWALLRDRSGLIWAGTARGLSRLDPRQDAVLSVFGGIESPLSDGDVFSVLAAQDGRIWFGLGKNGIDIVNPAGGAISRIVPVPSMPETALPNDRVLSLAGEGKDIYIGTSRGIYKSDTSGSTVKRMRIEDADPAMRINALLAIDGALWIGSRDDGVWRVTDGQSAHVLGLSDMRVTALAAAPDGQLYVGSRNGLDLIRRETLAVRVVSPSASKMPATYVSALLVDSKERLWMGTMGGGIAVSEKAGDLPHFRTIGVAQGLPSLNISRLLEDGKGRIWAATDNGLAVIDAATLAVRSVGPADGLGINNYWGGSGAATQSGELLFGGMGGVSVVMPQRLNDWTFQAPVVVTELRSGGIRLAAPGRGQAPVQVRPDGNVLNVEFAALDLSAPERNWYAYRLEGFDKDWTRTDASRRVATFTNLPPGSYSLQLRGTNREGSWSDAALSLPIEVLPTWYQTNWWRGFVLLLLVGSVLGATRMRTAALRLRQRLLESEVQRQTGELRLQQASLVAANAELAQSARTLRLLGDAGRDISANLEESAVASALHRATITLLDAQGFAIYRPDAKTHVLKLSYSDGDGLPPCPASMPMEGDGPAARAARGQPQVADGQPAALYAPLMAERSLMGILVLRTMQLGAYGERELQLISNLCAHGAIAFHNIETRSQLVRQERVASLAGMVAGMAHELNTPLGNMLSAMTSAEQVLEHLRAAADSGRISRSQLQADTGDALAAAQLGVRNAQRAVALINSFKAIVTRSTNPQTSTIELGSFLVEMTAMLRSELEQAGHRLQVQAEAGLKFDVDAEALADVLMQVLENARDHAFETRSDGTVSITAQRDQEDMVEIVIADNGHGIAEADLPRVFDPFFTTRSGLGGHVGLGLNVAFNHVTERLKGNIVIDSDAGGTRVTIRVPFSQH